MGLFNRKKKEEAKPESSVLLAMPMFNDKESFDIDKVVAYLLSDWGLTVTDLDSSNSETISFTVQNEFVILAKMPVPIPWGDIEGTAQYAYNWSTALDDLKHHSAHALVTIMSSNSSKKERFAILTKVLTAILATSNCVGIYQGTQSLLLPKDQYLDSAEALKHDFIPLDLWVYIGMRRGQETNSAYSYGLKAFGKLEMELVDAPMALGELHQFISQICAYVINSDVTFKSGETLGLTAEQKIKITQSSGTFVEGESYKLTF